MNAKTIFTLTAAAAVTASANAAVQTIDLDTYVHGRVLNGVDLGPAIGSADNFHRCKDLLVVFDTTERNTRDDDLEGPSGTNGSWAYGNLKASNEVVGNALIIQEYDRHFAGYTDQSKTVVKKPDDEGRRSGGTQPGAGEIYLDFLGPISSFGFTLIDVEKTGEFNNETGFFATFSGGGQSSKVAFADFLDPFSSFYDASVEFGNNSANRIDMISAGQLGLTSIENVTINFGGSAAIGELKYEPYNPGGGGGVVPTPSAAFAAITGLGGLTLFRRRRREA